MNLSFRPTPARLLAAPAAAGLAVLALAEPASAHVSISPSTTAAGAYTVLTVGVPHGCEGSPTTRVAIQIPEEILSVVPTRHPLWEVTKQKKRLAEPVTDAYGNKVTERDAVVVYTANSPLPDGYRDAFELSLQLPDEEGATLVFPSIQTCKKGETAWAEVAADGQDPEELEHPAPTVTITAPEGDGHGAAATDDSSHDSADDDSADDEGVPDEGGETMSSVALGAGALGLLTGGAALLQVRRRS